MGKIRDKFREIHEDLEANVTHIYQRRDLLTAIDLVYHSAMQFDFQGQRVRKGWVEGLIVGDTRCGKSETAARIVSHYRAGEIVTGENATFAGIVGGMQQTQKVWSITWGRMPLNDGRLLFIEEASGLDREIISKLSGVRSTGVAEITKIQSERTLARVRLLWLSNPRGRRSLADYNSGVESIQELIGQPEDIARFDFAMTVASNEVPMSVINSLERPKVPHRYTQEMCSALVLWSWSRKPENIIFTPEATEACLDYASSMAKKYSSAFPLVEGAEQRIKLAKLSVAAAARVFSTDDGVNLNVEADHVSFVHDYLDFVYSKPSFAYDLFSKAKFRERVLENETEIREKLSYYDDQFFQGLLDNQYFTVNDIQDLSGRTADAARELISFMVRNRCIRRGRTGYYKLPAFIVLLRNIRSEGREELGDDF